MSAETKRKGFEPWVTWALGLLLIVAVAFDAWGTWENNRILRERDFGRLYQEHEQHHREHAEILRRCAP